MSERNNLHDTRKFLPVIFVDEVREVERFDRGSWPAHITLFPPIQAPLEIACLDTIKKICEKFSPFTIEIGEDDFFGDNFDIHVRNVIDPTQTLHHLHEQFAGYLNDMTHDGKFSEFNPHVTNPDKFNLAKGTIISIGGVSVAAANSKYWRIQEIMELGHETASR